MGILRIHRLRPHTPQNRATLPSDPVLEPCGCRADSFELMRAPSFFPEAAQG